MMNPATMSASPAFDTHNCQPAIRRLCRACPVNRGITWYATPKIIMVTNPSRFMCMWAGRYTSQAGCTAMQRPSVTPPTSQARLDRRNPRTNHSMSAASGAGRNERHQHQTLAAGAHRVRLLGEQHGDLARCDGPLAILTTDEATPGDGRERDTGTARVRRDLLARLEAKDDEAPVRVIVCQDGGRTLRRGGNRRAGKGQDVMDLHRISGS